MPIPKPLKKLAKLKTLQNWNMQNLARFQFFGNDMNFKLQMEKHMWKCTLQMPKLSMGSAYVNSYLPDYLYLQINFKILSLKFV